MCCYRINTEVLLANLFARSKEYPISYSVHSVNGYLRFLSESFPTYLATNLSDQAICDCIVEYPELYRLSKDADGNIVVKSGEFRPNLNYFNAPFTKGVCNYMENVTYAYLETLQQEPTATM